MTLLGQPGAAAQRTASGPFWLAERGAYFGQVGYPRMGRENPFVPGGGIPGLQDSYLSKLARSWQPEQRQFGLADHISVPVSQLESQFTSALGGTVQGLYARAQALDAAATPLLSGTNNGVFDRRSATSSDAAVTATAQNGATVAGYDVQVLQLAQAQQNTGTQLLSTYSPSDIAAGVNTLAITGSSGTVTNVSFTVGAADTNLQALTTMRDAINSAGAGVDATVVTTQDVSQLVLTGQRTGAANGFTVSDVAGNAVTGTGTGTVTQAAVDALVRLDGVDQPAAQNRIDLDVPAPADPRNTTAASVTAGQPRVSLFLHDVTQGTARIDVTVALDANTVVGATRSLLNATNDMQRYTADKPQILSPGLLARLNAATDGLRDTLASVGVSVSGDGILALDEGAMRGALAQRPGDVEAAIGSIRGLAAREKAVAQTVVGSSGVAFATKPGPLGADYGRSLVETARLHNYLYGGLFVNLLA